jgi:phage terminase large subunit-like protein
VTATYATPGYDGQGVPRSPFAIAADLVAPAGGKWKPLPHQVPPPGSWFGWILFGGRGTGKTDAGAQYFYDHCMGPPCDPNIPGGHWPAIIAPTLGDGVTSCVNGPSGLRVRNPSIRVSVTPGGTVAKFPNGVEAKIFGTHTPEDLERLRSGGNRCIAWLEELAAWRYLDEAFEQMRYGLRIGPRPHWIASTTPKVRILIRKLLNQAKAGVDDIGMNIVMTHGTTDDNPHLAKHIRDMLYADYGGTRMGKQELEGLLLEDVENALWTEDVIARNRIHPAYAPKNFPRILVAIDPAASENGNEHGIVVVGWLPQWSSPLANHVPGLESQPHAFILEDASRSGSPIQWARRARQAYEDWGANGYVAEINNGHDLVVSNMRMVDHTARIQDVWASRGKAKRAEPVATLYEQNRVHHVGTFAHLEDQMVTWDPIDPDPAWSPDRMDAMVWGVSKLIVKQSATVRNGAVDNRLRGRR